MTSEKFFGHDQYIIDEKVSGFRLTNAYRVYDISGAEIGAIEQEMSVGQKALKLMVGKKMLPFTLHILDADGYTVATVRRGATLILSKTTVLDGDGSAIGRIDQKLTVLKPHFTIIDSAGTPIAEIHGDWKAWNFEITSADGRPLGTINKKWNGAAKEFFTNADRYLVTIDPSVAEDTGKMVIVAAAITIDMILKESTD